MEMPQSMDECIYFTRRVFQPRGKAIAWARRKQCPKCQKHLMGKPFDAKTGKPKIRSEDYECPGCHYIETKSEHEPTLTLEVIYTCPHCGANGDARTEYKRKVFEGVPSYVFECGSCHKKIGLAKKMKSKKGSSDDDEE